MPTSFCRTPRDLPISPSASRTACSRTRGCGSARARTIAAFGECRPIPARHTARACGPTAACDAATSFSSSAMAALSCRWYSSRAAVSRCQPLGCSSVATSSAVVALSSSRQPRLLELLGHDAIDPPAVAAAGQVEVLLDHRRQAGRVLDHLAVHVEHVQRAVGRVGELRRAEPDVGRGDELAPFVHAASLQPDAVGFEHLAMDDVAAHVADERLADDTPAERRRRGRSSRRWRR